MFQISAPPRSTVYESNYGNHLVDENMPTVRVEQTTLFNPTLGIFTVGTFAALNGFSKEDFEYAKKSVK